MAPPTDGTVDIPESLSHSSALGSAASARPPSRSTRLFSRLSLTKRRLRRVDTDAIVSSTNNGKKNSKRNNCLENTSDKENQFSNPANKRAKLDPQSANIPGYGGSSSSASSSRMMNGHHHKILESGRFSGSASSSGKTSAMGSGAASSAGHPPIASLCNLGNTCFLNSVLYTLRFTPGFLHSLHHMVYDLGLSSHVVNNGGKESKKNKGGNNSSNSNGHQNNSAGAAANGDSETELVYEVIEQLHDLFKTLSTCDDHNSSASSSSSSNKDPIPPSTFLNVVGKLNPLFEGNQQQDAHELLVCLLTTLQDINIPAAKTSNAAHGVDPAASSEDAVDHAALPPIPPKKEKEKKKGKKGFLMSNGHSSSNNSNNSGVKLLSATPKHDTITTTTGSGSGLAPGAAAASSKSKVADVTEHLPNFVRENFVGKTVFRTKCLECETCTYRSEKFTNIDIPLTFDDDLSESMSNGSIKEDSSSSNSHGGGPGGGGSASPTVVDLFLKQIMASETLRENNKYLCAECSRLNEAQRSVEYELLPKVMVLQLKRFTAATSKTAFMSKINDFIPTPFTMNCFCTQCMPPNSHYSCEPLPPPKHHYRLFAVIMHLGATLASGHYIAYVRASSDLSEDYSQCQRSNAFNSVERHKNGFDPGGGDGGGRGGRSNGSNKKGIMKYFSRSSDSSSRNGNIGNSSTSSLSSLSNGIGAGGDLVNGVGPGGGSNQNQVCRSANCCGMYRVLGQLNSNSEDSSSVSRSSNGHHHVRQRSQDSLESSSTAGGGDGVDHGGSGSTPTPPGLSGADDLWLECDDENISVITRRQFEGELNSKQSATTPYLLFYERI